MRVYIIIELIITIYHKIVHYVACSGLSRFVFVFLDKTSILFCTFHAISRLLYLLDYTKHNLRSAKPWRDFVANKDKEVISRLSSLRENIAFHSIYCLESYASCPGLAPSQYNQCAVIIAISIYQHTLKIGIYKNIYGLRLDILLPFLYIEI